MDFDDELQKDCSRENTVIRTSRSSHYWWRWGTTKSSRSNCATTSLNFSKELCWFLWFLSVVMKQRKTEHRRQSQSGNDLFLMDLDVLGVRQNLPWFNGLWSLHSSDGNLRVQQTGDDFIGARGRHLFTERRKIKLPKATRCTSSQSTCKQ